MSFTSYELNLFLSLGFIPLMLLFFFELAFSSIFDASETNTKI